MRTIAAAILFFYAAAHAVAPVHFSNPAHENRYNFLIKELRCLVCQNQTLAESNAELAADMRAVVAEMVRDGATEDDVAAFMTARYGDFVRYRPPLNLATAALWFAPFLLAAALLLWFVPKFFRRRACLPDAREMQKAADILEEIE